MCDYIIDGPNGPNGASDDVKKCGKRCLNGRCAAHLSSGGVKAFPVAVSHIIGRRKSMEDEYVINRNDMYDIYAVFDGHGGKQASAFAEEYFRTFLLNTILPDIKKMAKRFHEIILGIHHQTPEDGSGTTASLIVMYKKIHKMIVINIGDSRIMVIRKGTSEIITKDHNIKSHKQDVDDIVKNGGKIVKKYLTNSTDNSGVNLTRTIGDHQFPDLIRMPEITIVDYSDLDYILISCDGLWEETSEDTVREIILSSKSPSDACKKLVKRAYDDGSGDNITAMVIKLT
jgi:serine/threonine protein phosphatase PrpC